jgi:hypothetical protein
MMARDHIAGVTVSVVQDGQVVLKKGYGFAGPGRPVDPDRTLFRLGSISKTFDWIVVMNEVEAGRMRLDGPVNDYLPADLAIPAAPGWRPVELRDLMSHTPGFDDRILYHLFLKTPAQILPLAAELKLIRPSLRHAHHAGSHRAVRDNHLDHKNRPVKNVLTDEQIALIRQRDHDAAMLRRALRQAQEELEDALVARAVEILKASKEGAG